MAKGFSNILFGSRMAQVLRFFLANPASEFHQRKICLKLGLPLAAGQRYLNKLVKIGLVCTRQTGYRTYYFLNRRFPLLEEIRKLVSWI